MDDQAAVMSRGASVEAAEGERLRGAIRELCGDPSQDERDADPRSAQWPPLSGLDEGAEELVIELRAGLGRLAESRRREAVGGSGQLGAVLDWLQCSARGEILRGEVENVRRMLPGFAYLAVLGVADEAEALRAAERASGLVAA